MKLQKSQISIDNLLDALSRGRAAIKEAACIMVALADQDPRIYEKIMQKQPGLSLQLLVTLEKVGRGTIYDALLFDSSPAARRLLTLPYSQQKELYENPIKVVEQAPGKPPVVYERRVQQLTPNEVNKVFGPAGVRTVEQQIAAVTTTAAVKKQQPAQRYELMEDGSLVVHFAETKFSASQLEDIAARAKEKAIKSLKPAR